MGEGYKIIKKILILGLCLVLCGGFTGCGGSSASKKITVTMMYPIALEQFERLVEETYSDIDLQVEATTTGTINGDSERRLRNGRGTDLIITTLPTGDVKEYMLDLSATEYAAGYQATAMNPVMIEGKTYYLPLPGQYSGYILNKTLTEKLGLPIPATNMDLLALFGAGKEQGVGAGTDGTMFGIDTITPAAIGSYIIGTRVPDFLGLMDGIKWMDGFKEEKASFNGVWDDSLNILMTCVEKGYLNSKAIATKQANALPVKQRMLEGTLLLSYGNVRLLSQLCSETDKYEYVMLPFLSDQGNSPWAISSPDGFIGINRALDEKGKEGELDACRRILGLLSTQEGQDAWIRDTGATNSYLSGYEDNGGQIPEGLETCAAGGYIYNIELPSKVIQYFGQSMIAVLNGEMEMAEALSSVDDYYRNGSEAVDYDQSVVGSVSGDLLYENYNTRREETAIGNLVADAVAEYSGADIAVVNGGGIRASLYQGDVMGADLSAVCPYSNTIVVVEADGSVILEMLENGISLTAGKDGIPSGRFLQVSGLHYSYKPEDGNTPAKLLSVTLPDGTPLEPSGSYTLAVNNYMAGSSGYLDNNGDGYTMLNLFSNDVPKAEGAKLIRDTEATYADAMRAYFNSHQEEPVSAELEGRITVACEGE
ncbi:5'-nucleotidase C-terminal domain-containing protein [Qiania dongpingensis]|uniref:5'-nucleotidase C-terminal domain-containing protein n=1 Tax=Qiania dongpingensis TaxID=2763669 RepID=A0A7G9G3J1_9FIRM|nr:5'-nucleotidase C-terminal domain-containing protein [Qiania dongpingensis]QNM05373.1 5'-nucleotidase C-terminal domain-containing protein [Qiania dongpingensis]